MKVVSLTPRHALYRQGMKAAFRWDDEFANWDQIDAVRMALSDTLGWDENEWLERSGHYARDATRKRVYWIGVRDPANAAFVLLKFPHITNIEPREIFYD